jgi:hypothetical protein
MPPLSAARVLAIETAELSAWRDMYRAMPPDFHGQFEADLIEIGDVVLTRCRAIPFVHFNGVLSFGLNSPATEDVLGRVIGAYDQAGVRRITVMHHPFCLPEAIPGWLRARGFEARPGWDRVYRYDGSAAPNPAPARGDVALVQSDSASSWSAFLDGWYRLPTAPWLTALVGRPGWFHSVLRREGKIVAARSMFVKPGESAWLGVEAPVPGLMTQSFEDDHCLLVALVEHALKQCVQVIAGDVESPTATHQSPAYERWTALGFSVGYHRAHYVRG